MQEVSALFSISMALLIGAVSPGPSFVMVAKTAVTSGRMNGASAAIGMGVGGFLFATFSLLGLNSLLLASPILFLALKIAGGLYLAYLGLKIWRGAKQPLPISTDSKTLMNDRVINNAILGLNTQLSNPKTAIVYASVFAAFLPSTPSLSFNICIVALVFFVEAGWYSIVAFLLSSEAPRKQYLLYKSWVDRIAGGVMIALGLKLFLSAGD